MEKIDKHEIDYGASDPNEFAAALTSIFHQVRKIAATIEGSRITWLGDGDQQASSEFISPYLYDGISGIALFAAAYYSVTKDSDALELAVQCMAPLRLEPEQLAPSRNRAVAIGGMIGLGSFLYTFVRLADWLQEPEFLHSAQKVAALITPERIHADGKLDVVGGCAGTLLTLLAFAQEATAVGIDPQPALDLALVCGQHLLDRRVSYKRGPRAWPTIDRLPLPGFAHGAAGIACALAKLFEHTGRDEFREAAMEGFAFERCLYVPEQRAWLDPRFNRLPGEASWRYGAPGIALGRLGSISSIGLPALRYDLEEALNITRSLPDSPIDQLCCGNFGRVDIMHTAGNILERLHLSDYARELSRRVLDRAKVSGFNFEWSNLGATRQGKLQSSPSLLLGLAGIGYALLRLNYPDMFSSILLLEPSPQT